MPRIAVAFVVLALVTPGTMSAKAGVARWGIKTSLRPNPMHKTVSLSDLLALEEPQVKPSDDVQNARLQEDLGSSGLHEGDLVTVTGWLHLVAFENTTTGDEDYHIQISDSPTDGSNCVIIEAPKPEYIKSEHLSTQSGVIRQWINAKLLQGKEPSPRGNVLTHPVYVSATGQLFFDSTHEEAGDPGGGRGKKGMSAGTLWELHPLTDLRFAPKPQP